MLKRRRAILSIIDALGGETSRLQVMKLAWLLARDFSELSAFYQFVPYKYGPYSFTMARELGALVRDGLIEPINGNEGWRIRPDGRTIVRGLATPEKQPARAVVRDYGDLGTTPLLDYVYAEDPWVALNSVRDGVTRPKRPLASPAIYTVGYEKIHVEGLLDTLLRAGVPRLVDVRRNPASRRYGFHKSSLSDLCGRVGLEYQHLPQLGIDGSRRRSLDTAEDYDSLFKWYGDETLSVETDSIAQLAKEMQHVPSALLCAEADPRCCHRGVLARRLAEDTGMSIVHLAWPRDNQETNVGERQQQLGV